MNKIEKKIRNIFSYEIKYNKEISEPIYFRMNRETIEELILHLKEELNE